MNGLNTLVSILSILVSFLGSVAEGVRSRYTYTRYYYSTYTYTYRYYYTYTTYSISAGAIAGFVIAGLVVLVLLVGGIILCCVCCCRPQRGNQAQAGRVIASPNSTLSVVSTNQTSAAVAYYPTESATGNAPQKPHKLAYSASLPSYPRVASEGSVNLGFQDNK